LTATNAGGSDTETLTITIAEAVVAPVITSATTASGTVGTPFTAYTINATNSPTSYNATPLPAGLNLSNGVISGTPTTAGTTQVTLTATNAGGSDTETLTITIAEAVVAPVITSATTASGTVGTPFTYTISASNNATEFNTSTLPSWLSLNPTSGLLRGTPVASGLVDITLTARNDAGTDTESLRIKVGAEASVFQTIKFLSGASLPTGGEIVDYANGKVLTTNSGNGTHEVEIFTISSTGAFTGSADSVDLSSVFDGASNISSVSSVLADPRGFGVATVIPTATTEGSVGRIAIFNIDTLAILKTLDVGYHPDSLTITPDGTKLVVVNEGEFVSTSAETTFPRPGSISVVDISSVTTLAQAGNLTQSNVITYDFSSVNLATEVTINDLRNSRLDTLTTKTPNAADIEPEYATASNAQVFVTLQEANGVAVFDFATAKYSAIYELGTIEQLIDASDRDGANNTTSIGINDSVHGLPMPDTIARFTRGGVGYLLTANEGDARPDDGDIARGSTLTANMTTAVAALANNSGIGRLQLLRYEGDTDNDGLIDLPTMMGTRSFTIWNSSNGSLVYDSGSTLEMFAAANDPESFNTNSGNLSNTDTRSDDKGPEPEAVAYASLGGRDYAFLGCERQNGIYAFDITDLTNVKVVGYFNTISSTQDSGGAFISPESIKFIHAGTNPSGKNLLVVGYEGTGANGSVAVFEFAPVGVSSSTPSATPAPAAQSPAQKPLSSATTREEVKAIVSSKVQEALAKDPVKVKTTSQIAEILGVSKSTLSKIAKLAPSLKTQGGKINIAKLEKLIRNNPKAAALLTGNSEIKGKSKKSSDKK
jgi:PKD repeat protein